MDTPSSEEIIQNIVIKFTEVLDKHVDAIKHLADLQRSTDKATKSVKKHTKALQQMKRLADASFKRMAFLGKTINTTFKIALSGVATAVGAIIASIEKSGDTFHQLELSSINAGRAMDNLRKIYVDLDAHNNDMILSMRDLSESFVKFQTNISRRFILLDQDAKKGFTNIVDTLSRGIGRDAADQLLGDFFSSMEDYRERTVDVLTSLRDVDIGNIRGIRQIGESLSSMKLTGEQAEKLVPILQALEVRAQQLQGDLDNVVTPVRNLTDAGQRIGRIFEGIQRTVIEQFGTQFGRVIEDISIWLNTKIPDAISTAVSWLEKMGGADALLDKISSVLLKIWKNIKKVGEVAKEMWPHIVDGAKKAKQVLQPIIDVIKWMYDKFPKLTLGAAAFVAVFGVRNTFSVLWDGVKALGRFTGMLKASRAAAAGMCSQIDCNVQNMSRLSQFFKPGGFGGGFKKIFGVGGKGLGGALAGTGGQIIGGALGGLAGHIGGKAAARAAGAEEYSGLEQLAGAGGAAIGGLAIAGPVGAAIAALASSLTSLIQSGLESKRVIEQLDKAIENNKEKTKEYTAAIKESAKDIVTPFEVVKQQRKEATAELMKLEDQLAEAQKGDIWSLWGPKQNEETKKIGEQIDLLKKKVQEFHQQMERLKPPSIEMEEKGIQISAEAQKQINNLQEQLNDKKQLLLAASKENESRIRSEKESLESQINTINKLATLDAERKIILQKINELQTQAPKDKSDVALHRIEELRALRDEKEKSINAIKEFNKVQEEYATKTEQAAKASMAFKSGVIDEKELKKVINAAKESGKEAKKLADSFKDDSAKKAVEDITTKLREQTNVLGDLINESSRANLEMAKFKQTAAIIGDLTGAMSGFSDILMAMGPTAVSGGESIANALQRAAEQSLRQADEAFRKTERLRREARAKADPSNLFEATRLKKEAKSALERGDKAESDRLNKESQIAAKRYDLVDAARLEKEASDQLTIGLRAREEASKNLIALQETRIHRIGQIRDVVYEEMRMSEAMYGTVGLAVKKRLQIVSALNAERQQLQQSLDIYERHRNVAQQQLEVAIASGASQEDIAELQSKVWYWEGKRLDIAKELRRVQAEQLQQVKDLRDGYLDAVRAQAFGAGRFQKILITQEQNIAKGLEKQTAKESFLLGQVGESAGRSKVQPTRFSATGMGQMEMGGNLMTDEDIAEKNRELIKNISNENARIQAEESQRMLGGVFSNFEQTSSLSVRAYNANTAATDRLTDAISKASLATGAVGVGATGGPAADVLTGEAARKTAETPFNAIQNMFRQLLHIVDKDILPTPVKVEVPPTPVKVEVPQAKVEVTPTPVKVEVPQAKVEVTPTPVKVEHNVPQIPELNNKIDITTETSSIEKNMSIFGKILSSISSAVYSFSKILKQVNAKDINVSVSTPDTPLKIDQPNIFKEEIDLSGIEKILDSGIFKNIPDIIKLVPDMIIPDVLSNIDLFNTQDKPATKNKPATSEDKYVRNISKVLTGIFMTIPEDEQYKKDKENLGERKANILKKQRERIAKAEKEFEGLTYRIYNIGDENISKNIEYPSRQEDVIQIDVKDNGIDKDNKLDKFISMFSNILTGHAKELQNIPGILTAVDYPRKIPKDIEDEQYKKDKENLGERKANILKKQRERIAKAEKEFEGLTNRIKNHFYNIGDENISKNILAKHPGARHIPQLYTPLAKGVTFGGNNKLPGTDIDDSDQIDEEGEVRKSMGLSKLFGLLRFQGVNVSKTDLHGFDMRSAAKIMSDRDKNKRELNDLNKARQRAAKKISTEKDRQKKLRERLQTKKTPQKPLKPIQPTTEEVGNRLPKTSLSRVNEFGNIKGTNRNISLGQKSSPQDWSGQMKMVADILRKLGPLLDDIISSDDDIEMMRPTRSGGRTNLGGPGT